MENSLKIITKVIERVDIAKIPNNVKEYVLDYISTLTKTDAVVCGVLTIGTFIYSITTLNIDTKQFSDGRAIEIIDQLYNFVTHPDEMPYPDHVYDLFYYHLTCLKSATEINVNVCKAISTRNCLEKLYTILVHMCAAELQKAQTRLPLTSDQTQDFYEWISHPTYSIYQVITFIIKAGLLNAKVEDIPIEYMQRATNLPSEVLPIILAVIKDVAEVINRRPETRQLFLKNGVDVLLKSMVENMDEFDGKIWLALRYLAAEARKMDPSQLTRSTIEISRSYNPGLLSIAKLLSIDLSLESEAIFVDSLLYPCANYFLGAQSPKQMIFMGLLIHDSFSYDPSIFIDNTIGRIITRSIIGSFMACSYYLSINSVKGVALCVTHLGTMFGIGYMSETVRMKVDYSYYLRYNKDKLTSQPKLL